MQTSEEMIARAKSAQARGDLDTAEAFLARAKAIKAGPAALKALETMAEGRMAAPAFIRGERAAQQQDARIDKAMSKAIKIAGVDELDSYASKLADELHGGSYSQIVYDKRRAYLRYLKGADINDLGDIAQACVLSPRQIVEAIDLGLNASEVKATMVSAQESLGGFLAPETLSETIMGRAASLNVVRARATVDVAGPAGSLSYAVWRGSGDTYSTALRGVWGSETQLSSVENLTVGKAALEPKLWRLKVVVSKSLLEDGGPMLINGLHSKFAEAYATAEDAEMLVGQGVTAPLGILAQDAGTLRNPDVRVTNSGSATDITADGILNALYSLPGQYRSAPGFAIAMSAATVKRVRLLKDGSGRYIYSDDYKTLCGYTVAESESMPAIAAGNYPILFGDFAGYGIGDKIGLSIQLYQDSALADTDSAAFYLRRRVGGAPVEGYRFAALKVSA